ncbi:TMAO reductase system periplasmic protein TorT [Vibrio sp. kj40-1]|uniref:TMAO reductase system periplasmic protein TorT n=1 Tax=Vibrio algarum TaxID=3020714 RepID=A0ABT4YYE9_9VIBR|nr:TMAO reductase system periplasmic protein TorT [Vibrio sp. KJ40-1]MDB1126186.1 TMAO reductase system periplasmic protein TorT [Vibrio sp. KJ40-1]
MLSTPIVTQAAEKICAIYPHLKDSYWLSVNYGMVSESKLYGIDLKVFESGGYPNLNKQRQQLANCRDWGADAIILGTVSPQAYMDQIPKLIGDIPLFSTVNKLYLGEQDKPQFKGSVGVDWYWMGYNAGQYLAQQHPKGSGNVKIAWLPGPKMSGGTKPSNNGFYDAIQDSDVTIVSTLWADNDKELQRNLVQQVLEETTVDYIVGSAVAIEAAISEVRAAGKEKDIRLVSFYFSHGIYRALLRDKVLFTSTDKMVLQGRLSIRQAHAFLNKIPYSTNESPTIETLTPNSLKNTITRDSLSPSEFRPTFSVTHEQ